MKPIRSTPALKNQRLSLLRAASLSFSVRFICILFTAALFALAVSEEAEAQDSIASLPVAGCTDGSYVSNPGSNAGLVSDCKVLVAVRNHWTGHFGNADLPSTHPLRTWGTESSTVGLWAGVSVINQRVIELDLHAAKNVGASSSISGTLTAQLGNLTSLKSLYLNGNQLTGTIPGELGDITGLRSLYLNGNGLTGAIPGELGDLSSLTHLHLSGNGLTGSIDT